MAHCITLPSSRYFISTVILVLILGHFTNAQNVGIGTTTPHSSAILDLSSDSLGILIPRMTAAQRDGINSPVAGLMVFVTDDYHFYCYEGSAWEKVGAAGAILEDSDQDTKVTVEQNPDDDMIRFEMGGTEYFRMQQGRLEVLNTGQSVFLGQGAGASDDLTDNLNVFIGDSTGTSNTTGWQNVATGHKAMYANTTGDYNVASGSYALFSNTIGDDNVAQGIEAMYSNISGNGNIASGSYALWSNTTGNHNIAQGLAALYTNTTGIHNIAQGYESLEDNTTGSRNVAVGYRSLNMLTTGHSNVAVGDSAGLKTMGSNSVFLGNAAGSNETLGNRLYIENSNADANNALIYGEFDNDLLRVNGTLNVKNGFADKDLDTRIQLEETADDDIIRFDMGGTEYFRMDQGRLEVLNSGRSVFVGRGAGASDNLTSNANVFIGDSTGTSTINGNDNVAAGSKTLYSNIGGHNNIAAGRQTMFSNTAGYRNVALGEEAMFSNTEGLNNIAMGYQAAFQNTSGSGNLALGGQSLHNTTTGGGNVAMNWRALYSNTEGQSNIGIGSRALYSSTTANNNVAVGYYSGYSTLGGNGVYLGSEAGYFETQGNRLYIETTNADKNNALIYGEFDNNLLALNANVGIGTSTPGDYKLHVKHSTKGLKIEHQSAGGNFWELWHEDGSDGLWLNTTAGNVGKFNYASGAYTSVSDRRLKTNFKDLDLVLQKVMKLEPLSYKYKADVQQKEYLGFVAQDVEKLFPQLVSTPETPDEPYTMDYSGFGVVAIRAIQEQQEIIDSQASKIADLEKRLESIEALLTATAEK